MFDANTVTESGDQGSGVRDPNWVEGSDRSGQKWDIWVVCGKMVIVA